MATKINQAKYRNAILFFASRIQNGTLGKLKLMKLLYYFDFDFFEEYGRSVTGDEYLRFENGPVPRMEEKILGSSRKCVVAGAPDYGIMSSFPHPKRMAIR